MKNGWPQDKQQLKAGGVKGLEKEKRSVDERIKANRREIENLLGMVKGEGVSVETSQELARLEEVKRGLEAKSGELAATISHRNKAVYDVDAMAGALQRFARFIYKLPIEWQIQALHLLVKQVLIGKDFTQVTLHELPIAELDRALDVGGDGGEPKKFDSRRLRERQESDTTCRPDFPRHPTGTSVVESRGAWRGRREQKTTEDEPEGEEAPEIMVGERYLTPAGAPVQVLAVAGEQILIQSLASENRFPLPLGYPLRRWGSDEPAFPVKDTPNRPIDEAQPTRPPEKRPIAPLIDAMLLAGNVTMKGILRELRRKASAACHGEDLRANVRARLSHLRRKGLQPRLAGSDDPEISVP